MADSLSRRYLDNAATSWPKPDAVITAWNDAAIRVGATAGRAAYREAVEADAIRHRARTAAARLLGGVDPRRVALPAGCTLALNMAIHGLVKPGDHVIATSAGSIRPRLSHGRITSEIAPDCSSQRSGRRVAL